MGAVLICGDRNWRGKAIIKKVLAVAARFSKMKWRRRGGNTHD